MATDTGSVWTFETEISGDGCGGYSWTLIGFPPEVDGVSTGVVIDGGEADTSKMARFRARTARKKAVKMAKDGTLVSLNTRVARGDLRTVA